MGWEEMGCCAVPVLCLEQVSLYIVHDCAYYLSCIESNAFYGTKGRRISGNYCPPHTTEYVVLSCARVMLRNAFLEYKLCIFWQGSCIRRPSLSYCMCWVVLVYYAYNFRYTLNLVFRVASAPRVISWRIHEPLSAFLFSFVSTIHALFGRPFGFFLIIPPRLHSCTLRSPLTRGGADL